MEEIYSLFPLMNIKDISDRYTESQYISTLHDAIDNEDVLHVVRRCESTEWFFTQGFTMFDIILIIHRVVIKAKYTELNKIQPFLARLETDDSTTCCVCWDDYEECPDLDETSILRIVEGITNGTAGISCSRCGNYVCRDCVENFKLVRTTQLQVCPVCIKTYGTSASPV